MANLEIRPERLISSAKDIFITRREFIATFGGGVLAGVAGENLINGLEQIENNKRRTNSINIIFTQLIQAEKKVLGDNYIEKDGNISLDDMRYILAELPWNRGLDRDELIAGFRELKEVSLKFEALGVPVFFLPKVSGIIDQSRDYNIDLTGRKKGCFVAGIYLVRFLLPFRFSKGSAKVEHNFWAIMGLSPGEKGTPIISMSPAPYPYFLDFREVFNNFNLLINLGKK